MDAEEARTIGWSLWRVRDTRGKSLRVIAELAGIEVGHPGGIVLPVAVLQDRVAQASRTAPSLPVR